jgi:HEAT repeat protein
MKVRRARAAAIFGRLTNPLAKFLFAAAAFALAIAAAIFFAAPDPRYLGRSFSHWANDLRSADPAVRQRAAEVFREAPGAVHFLSERVDAGPGPVERFSSHLAGYLPETIRKSFRRLYDPGRKLRDKHLAAQTLQQLGTNAQEAIPALGRMLRDSNALLASSASVTLAQMGAPAVPVLVAALNDPDYNVRASACTALAQIGASAAPAVPALASIVAHESGPILTTAAYTLCRIRTPAVPALCALLASTNSAARSAAAFALGQMGFDAAEAIPLLATTAREDRNIAVRWAAVEALGRASNTSRESAEALLACLNDTNATIRGLAIAGLTNRPSIIRRNASRIESLLNDASPLVRSNAHLALERFVARAPDLTP